MKYLGLLHELNSPIASLQALLFTNQKHLSPELHEKLSHHLTRLIQTSSVVSEILAADLPSEDHVVKLLKIWLELHQTPVQDFVRTLESNRLTITHTITGPTTKTEYAQLIWSICRRQTKLLGGQLHKSPHLLTLTLPHHSQP